MWDIFEEMEKMAYDKGRTEGKIEGEIEGEIKGEDKLSQLHSVLIEKNKLNELKRSVSDKAYRKRLYKKYHIG